MEGAGARRAVDGNRQLSCTRQWFELEALYVTAFRQKEGTLFLC